MIELKNVTKIYGHTTVIQNAEYSSPTKDWYACWGNPAVEKQP